MTTPVAPGRIERPNYYRLPAVPIDILPFFAPLGRLLYAFIFIVSMFSHLQPGTVEYAASGGVPVAEILVPFTGIIALLGGMSVALGYYARVGAFLILLFLIPVTFVMHDFWQVVDPQAAMLQRIMFFKNLGLIGAAMLIVYFGAGPYSFDSHREHRFDTR